MAQSRLERCSQLPLVVEIDGVAGLAVDALNTKASENHFRDMVEVDLRSRLGRGTSLLKTVDNLLGKLKPLT